MERYRTAGIDELRRMVLPLELRKRLGFEVRKTVVGMRPVNSLVILLAVGENDEAERFVRNIDEMGRIVVPGELMEEMGWDIKDKVAVYQADDRTAILRL